MSRQDKKERNRLKRKRKHQELRKRKNASVFQTLAHKEGPIECYINSNWHESGEASINVLRPLPDGGNLVAAFLVDLWCSGLKDAFGRLNIARSDFHEHLNNPNRDFQMLPLDLITAQRLIAGGMRLSVENGFRLPHKASRWASVLGVDSYANADLSDFEKPGGKYLYIGSLNDLRKRLVGPVDAFLARKDVEYVLENSPLSAWDDQFDEEDDDSFIEEADTVDEDSFNMVRQSIARVRQRGVKMVEEWLVSRGQTPHPYLGDAFMLTLMSAVAKSSESKDAPTPEEVIAPLLKDHPDPQGLIAAVRQLSEFTNQGDGRSRIRGLIDDHAAATDSTESSPSPQPHAAPELQPFNAPPQ
jgi:hypothetical protein